ncbi:hypothetical protein Aperf_G00000110020 [Anoplocephala perfoliata]
MPHVNPCKWPGGGTASYIHTSLRTSTHLFPLALLSLLLTLSMTLPLANPSPLIAGDDPNITLSPSLEVERRGNVSDPRRIMCGYQLIINLKEQCGARGTYSPYYDSVRVKRGLRLHRATKLYSSGKIRRKKHDEFCALYLRYEPFTIITECCCRGCTRRFLEQYCAKE